MNRRLLLGILGALLALMGGYCNTEWCGAGGMQGSDHQGGG
jgi:hypothetical protein